MTTIDELADEVHHRLAHAQSDDPDRVLFLTYAWFVIKCEENGGSEWIDAVSGTQIADLIDTDLRKGEPDRQDRLFNSTKYAPWKAWIDFVGLSGGLGAIDGFYPSSSARLQRELAQIGARLGFGKEIDAGIIVSELSSRMPYLDGGEHFTLLSSKTNRNQPIRQLSWLLSNGLRDLHDLQRLQLLAPGDTSNAYSLRPDPLHPIQHVKTVVLEEALLK